MVIPNTSSCGAPGPGAGGIGFQGGKQEKNKRKKREIQEEYKDVGKMRRKNPWLDTSSCGAPGPGILREE